VQLRVSAVRRPLHRPSFPQRAPPPAGRPLAGQPSAEPIAIGSERTISFFLAEGGEERRSFRADCRLSRPLVGRPAVSRPTIWKVAPCYITVISHLRYVTLSEMDITPGKMDITCVI
jgi:hypothetical protein